MAKARNEHPEPTSDGVLVISVWKQGPQGFLGRLTMTGDDAADSTVEVVHSPDDLLDSVRSWLASLP